jgi:trehalose 6-phosphate phosphatase
MPAAPGDPFASAVARLRQDPERTAVLLDFDGTLAPIVEDPAAAVPFPGVAALLAEVAARYGVVAVISGRPVDYLRRHLPPAVLLAGLYGLERVRDGQLEVDPVVEAWRPVVEAAVAAAGRDLPDGLGVEDKGLSLTLHARPRPDLAEEMMRWADRAASRWGLDLRTARMSVELHPHVAVDKGTVTAELLAGTSAACFIGDDVGDLPAFAALEAYRVAGGAAVRAVVTSPEVAPELLAVADVVLDGPSAVADLLRSLID